jgi:predicted cupin superfamily sugar epimerase
MNADNWIKHLALTPHPEGGFFRETYRSEESVPEAVMPGRFRGDRSVSTAIYFLLKRGQISRLHRIASDEMWHHYAGGTLLIHGLTPTGDYVQFKLGKESRRGEVPQVLVPAGTWFGATLRPRVTYALVGCTVAPGFDFADFEMGDAARLKAAYPQHQALIERLCPATE